jgi:hypothetical protein
MSLVSSSSNLDSGPRRRIGKKSLGKIFSLFTQGPPDNNFSPHKAYRHRWTLLTTGHRVVRFENWRWILDIQMDRHSGK